MTHLKKVWCTFTTIALILQSYPVFAFDQTYFDRLPDKDKQTINLVNSVNSAVVSITGRKKVAENDARCFIIFNGICITTWDQPPPDKNGEVDIIKWSGFFIAKNGYIITNNHVVEQTDLHYEVMTLDGKKYPATILSSSRNDDIALIKINGNGFPYLKLYNSDNLMIGQGVYAIWNALGEYQNTVTQGIVSGLDRIITAGWQDGSPEEVLSWAIQTSASISSGNSGWPLLDSIGNIIGINTAIDLGGQNIGFAIPSNKIIHFITDYRDRLKK